MNRIIILVLFLLSPMLVASQIIDQAYLKCQYKLRSVIDTTKNTVTDDLLVLEITQEDYTILKNPGKDNMEIITKEGNKINKYTPSEEQSSSDSKRGKKVGIAYELENGEIIYVPE